MTAAPSLFEFFVERTCETMGMNSTGKTQALSRILRLLQLMSDDIQRTVCTAYVSQRFGIEQAVLLRMGRGGERSSLPASIRASDPPASSTERLLFEVLIKHPKFAAETLLQFPPEQFEDKWCQNVAKLMQEKLKANKEETLGDLTEGVADEEFKGELRRIMFGPDRCGDDEAGQFVKDCLKKLKQRPTRQRLSTINHDIRHAEISGDEEKLFALLNEKKRLVREVERPEGLSQSDKI